MSGISETINEFFNFDIFDENNNELYCCNDIVIYKNELYKSLVNNNNRNPHDADAWFYIGTLEDIINYIIADDKGYKLDIPYYPESTNSCHSMFSKGQCVVDKVPKTDALGIPIKDDCGNVTYDYLIFNSLIDCNTTPPLVGSQANPPTWTQGLSVCEYLAGSVGWTQNGDTENYQVSSSNPQCLLDCSAPDDETIALATQGTEGTHSQTIGNKLRVRHDTNTLSTTPANGLEVNLGKGLTADANGISIKLGDSSIIVDDDGIKLGEIRTDPAGNPINADTCLVTCDGLGNGLTIEGGKVVINAAEVAAAIAAVMGGGTEPNSVFVNTNNPNTATVFDDENPPVTNDPLLAQNNQYLYVGADGSQWTWNGTAYITSPQNTTVGAGSSAVITRIFPASPSGTLLSASATGLFVFEGLRFDIRWQDSSTYNISLVNTTASPIALSYNVGTSLGATTTIAAGAVKLFNAASWPAGFTETVSNVVVNNKWYVLRAVGYPSGTARMVHMVLERRV